MPDAYSVRVRSGGEFLADGASYRAWSAPAVSEDSEADSLQEHATRLRHSYAAHAHVHALLDQLQPGLAQGMRAALAGDRTQAELARERAVHQSTISRSLQKGLRQLRIIATLPTVAEPEFWTIHEPWVTQSVKRQNTGTTYFDSIVEKRLRVLWVYWQTSSLVRTHEVTGVGRQYTAVFVAGVLEYCTDQWAGYWRLVRDNHGFRYSKK